MQPPADTPAAEPPRRMRRLVPALHPLVVYTALFAVSLLVTPFVYHWQDVEQFWVPWMRNSEGWYPWKIYQGSPGCNYPPFCLYLLTAVERVRLLLHAPPASTATVCLVKFPLFLAHPLGVLVCYYGLRRPFGGKTARRIALLYALCLPLFVNGALWGQADALMLLAVVSALVLLANDKPEWAGAAMGWALSIKFQSVFVAPILLLYTLRRFGIARTLLGVLAGAGALLVVSLPFLLAGTGRQLLASYTDAAGYYPFRSLNAMNLWGALNWFDTNLRHLNGDVVNSDARPAVGPLTFHHVGLILFGTYALFLLIVLWRRPTRDTLFFTSGLCALGLFTLSTQMHERYVVPAAAILALPALFSPRRLLLYAGVCVTAGMNEVLVLYSNYYSFAVHRDAGWVNVLWDKAFVAGSLLNCVLLAFGTYLLLRPDPAVAPPAGPPPAVTAAAAAPPRRVSGGAARRRKRRGR